MGNLPANVDDAELDEQEVDHEEYVKFLNGELDVKDRLADVFKNDPTALEEIERIVRGLEGQKEDASVVTEWGKKIAKMVESAERREQRARRAETREAQEKADNWFEG